MSPGVGLIVFLIATVGLLAAAVVTGLRARRRLHVTSVVLALVSLGITIFWAEKLGELYDLDQAGWVTPVHLAFAKVTTVAFLLPVVTGLRTLRHPATRTLHRRVVVLVLTLVAITSVLGTWMVLASEPLP